MNINHDTILASKSKTTLACDGMDRAIIFVGDIIYLFTLALI